MRTIIAAAVIVITALLQLIGINITADEREVVITSLVIIGSALSVVYTRYTATRNMQTGELLNREPPVTLEVEQINPPSKP